MTFSITQLFSIGLIYLTVLFGSAYATELGWLPKSLTHHRLTRVLALGVFAGTICFNGTLGLATQYGSSFMLYFLGASAAFMAAPLLLAPICRIALTHKLGSLADVFAFRYPAPWVGGVVSLFMLIGLLPLIALQIHAVSITVHLLNQDFSEDVLAIIFCSTMTLFAILFGAMHLSTRDKHQGLVVAMGLDSVIKLVALTAIAIYAVNDVFGGLSNMNAWLTQNISQHELDNTLATGPSRTLLLLFFAAAVAMPHVYHILITENENENLLNDARWGFPIYMLCLSACIPPILWAAMYLGAETPAEFHVVGLGLTAENRSITILAFVVSLAAASGVLIVTTLALSTMILNHVFLPLYTPKPGVNVFSILFYTRRILVAGIIFLSYCMYKLLAEGQNLTSLGIVAFVAVLQFLPGLFGAFYWRRANKAGLLAGLLLGYLIWFATLFYPLLSDIFYASFVTPAALGYQTELQQPGLYELQESAWHIAAMASLTVNALGFFIFSLLSKTSNEELRAANECLSDSFYRPSQGSLIAQSVEEIELGLQSILGANTANLEIQFALAELKLDPDEQRPHMLHQIRNQLESNLSTTLGQTISHSIIDRFVPFNLNTGFTGSDTVYSVESRLEDYQSQLTGMAAELDALRRHHRLILQELPTAVCAIAENQNVLIWNAAMERLTKISAGKIIGSALTSLPDDWFLLLDGFAIGVDTHRLRASVSSNGDQLLVNLHKASIDNIPTSEGDVVIVIEDMTDEHILEEQLLHNERLASIGQLSAGIAHEIGNPITGIACLAQNMKFETEEEEFHLLSDQILEQTGRVSEILQSLINFSYGGRAESLQPYVPVDIKQCVTEAISLLSLSQQNDHINFKNRLKEDCYVLGNAQRLSQVFVNIFTNARDASRPGDVIEIASVSTDGSLTITITDQGYGIPSEKIGQVFEPFFTTKDPGKGTGLGLAIVNTIVQEHHGSISATPSSKGSGTCITITVPYFDRQENIPE
ncbi:MAG: signal transduction histidine kinase [Candidatus Azotimanducaceae bacterium]|jgi:signal transduction histidine kinase